MHHKIDLRGTKKEVVTALSADKGPDASDVKLLHTQAVKLATGLLASQPDDRKVEVIAYLSVGEPAGSLSFSLKIEG